MQYKNPIQTCFSKAAATYDEYSDVQQQVGMHLLTLIPNEYYSTLIDIGCGTGFLTEHLIKTISHDRSYALDFSETLLNKTKQRLPTLSTIIQADFEQYQQRNAFDLIYSNMALHWSSDFKACLAALHHNLKSQGDLVFTIPLQNTFKELQSFSVQNFMDKESILNLLSATGFTIQLNEVSDIILTFDTLLDALHMIKKVGANYVANRNQLYIHKSQLKQNKLFQLTYRIGYFVARKST